MMSRFFSVSSARRAFALFQLCEGLSTTTTPSRRPLYVTTPIYYVNAAPHVGHAYTSVATDALTRFAKLDGRPARLCTGTDEHGEKVEESAVKVGLEPLDFATRISHVFKKLADKYSVEYDTFVRTTSKDHKRAVTKLWETLQARDQIYLGSYEGWYCVRDECYYTEGELVDGKAPTGAPVEWRTKEPSYFFKLSEYQDQLIDKIDSDTIRIAPAARKNEVLSFLKTEKLRDLSVSRTTFKWGVQVPGDDDHVVYVWLDALANYISAVGYAANNAAAPAATEEEEEEEDSFESSSSSSSSEDFSKWWTGAEKVHVVGKDILRFHAVYWPAICMAAQLPCPDVIVAHGWWTSDGRKISKSLGNVVDPFELLETYGLDATRYFLLSEVPFGADGDYSKQAMLAAANGFLANAVGNFAQRVCVMLTKKPCDATAPKPATQEDLLRFAPDQPELLAKARDLAASTRRHLLPLEEDEETGGGQKKTTKKEVLRFDLALKEIEDVVREANKFFDSAAPWTLKKGDPDAMVRALAVALELLRCIAIAYQPFMPDASRRLLDQIGVPLNERDLAHIALLPGLAKGTPIAKPQHVFPRIDLPDD